MNQQANTAYLNKLRTRNTLRSWIPWGHKIPNNVVTEAEHISRQANAISRRDKVLSECPERQQSKS